MSRLGLALIETPDKTKSHWGELTVLDQLMTKALILLGFSTVHQWLHHSWILAKYCKGKQQQQVLSSGLRTTVSSVESYAEANSLFSTSSNISLVHRINRRGPNTLPCGTPEIIGIYSFAAPSTTALCLRSERNSVQMDSTLPPTQFEYDTNVTHSIEGCTKSSWTIWLHPCI